MSTVFPTGPGYEGSMDVMVSRNFHEDDVWPHGAGASKDTLEDGMHPVLAAGGQTAADGRPLNVVGQVMHYNADGERVVMNVAPGHVAIGYVANVLTYSGGSPNTFETSLTIMYPVYVDDSTDLAAGVTLSLSPLNENDVPNPLAGYLWYDQTEDEDVGIGGGNEDAWPKTVADSLTYTLCNVMLVGFAQAS